MASPTDDWAGDQEFFQEMHRGGWWLDLLADAVPARGSLSGHCLTASASSGPSGMWIKAARVIRVPPGGRC